jgi:hypothetical protein
VAVADQRAGRPEYAEVEVGAAFVARAQPLEGVQPGEAALDHPAVPAQAGAVGDPAAGDPWGDAPGAQPAAVDVVVVAAVGAQLPRLASGPAAQAADRRDGIQQRDQLGDVVALPPVSVTAGGMPPASQIR